MIVPSVLKRFAVSHIRISEAHLFLVHHAVALSFFD
jgi:hypothetical protein